jgi:integrase/recombinase XerD
VLQVSGLRIYRPDRTYLSTCAVIVRGKGGKGRRVGFGDRTGAALSRYLRARRRHSLAGSDMLWLAERGRELHYDGLYMTLRRRAERAGIERFHPHMLRHTMAVSWVSAGGSVTGLMSQGGWSSVDLVQRYLGAAQSGLAIEEARRLRLGDI